MVRAVLVLIATWAFGTTEARAGAWPRDEGEVFLSFGGAIALSGDPQRPVEYDPMIYAEYGWSPRLTLGLDAYSADTDTSGGIFAWARLPLGSAEGDAWAVSAGIGATLKTDDGADAAARLGLHWGRGLETGWLAVDAYLQAGLSPQTRQAKVDVSWGRRFKEDWTILLQGQLGHDAADDIFASTSSSLNWTATDQISLRAGVTQSLTGDRDAALTFETWLRF